VLHIALIVAGAYACAAVLAYLLVLPILRAGRAADESMAAEELPQQAAAEDDKPAPARRRFRRRRAARRIVVPLAGRRPH
jgi:hypothetical protein